MKKTQMVATIIVITGIVALIIVAVIGGIRFGVGSIRRIFDSLDPQTGIILGVASLVGLLCAWILAAAIRSAKQREIENRTATQRASLYEAVLESLAARLSGSLDQPALKEALLLKASTPVLKEYRLLLSMLSDVNADHEQRKRQVNRLLLVMRRDCGLSTYGLENEDWFAWMRNRMETRDDQHNGSSMQAARLGVHGSGVAHRL
jgi:hypothetical protein